MLGNNSISSLDTPEKNPIIMVDRENEGHHGDGIMKTATQICQYKGRTYLLLWSGKTRFGTRAKLGFMDGSKEFWVELSAISGVADKMESHRVVAESRPMTASRPTRQSSGLGRRTGCSCGSRENGSQDSDCSSCRFDQDDN